ncbi:hypothetical protein MRX96_015934 [Rhipicephalus microplus]
MAGLLSLPRSSSGRRVNEPRQADDGRTDLSVCHHPIRVPSIFRASPLPIPPTHSCKNPAANRPIPCVNQTKQRALQKLFSVAISSGSRHMDKRVGVVGRSHITRPSGPYKAATVTFHLQWEWQQLCSQVA